MKSFAYGHQVHIHWLLIAVVYCVVVVETSQADFSSSTGPALVSAIPDQTLYLSNTQNTRESQRTLSSYFIRDLRDSFGGNQTRDYSVYVYDADVSEGWISNHYLIVRSKQPGITQVAVTANSDTGSTIDWFVVQVIAAPTSDQDESARHTVLSPRNYYANALGEYNVHWEVLDTAAESLIVPDLPTGLNFNAEEMNLSGKADTSTIFAIISGPGSATPSIEEFQLMATRDKHSEVHNNLLAITEIPSTTSNVVRELPYRRLEAASASTQGSYTGGLYRIQYSRPNTANQESMRVDRLFSGLTDALHTHTRSDLHPNFSQELAASRTRFWNSSSYIGTPKNQQSSVLVGLEYQAQTGWYSGIGIGTASINDEQTSTLSGRATGVLPYLRWQGESGNQIWGALGVGVEYPSNSDPSNTLLGVVGWRQPLKQTDSLLFSSIGDLGFRLPLASQATQEEDESLFSSASKSIRAGVEVAFTGYNQVVPYIGVSGKLNSFVDSQRTDVETRGGLRLVDNRGLSIEAEGRTQSTLHASDDLAWGVSLAAHLDPGLRGEGLAISLSPSYGTTSQTAMPTLGWLEQPTIGSALQDYNQAWAMSGALSYGMPLMRRATVTPFGQISISTLNKTRMGFRVALDPKVNRNFDLEVASVRYKREQDQLLDQGIDVQLRLVF